MQYPAHGANPQTLYEQLHIPLPETLIDLSENVNALGFPESFRTVWADLLQQLPTYPHEQAEPLRSMLAVKHGITNQHIVIGNGAAELLMALAQLYRQQKVVMIHPTFSEYARTLHQHNAEIMDITVDDVANYTLPMEKIRHAMQQAQAIYVCNPNNPTGVLLSKKELFAIIEYGQQVQCDVVIDEAFMDWTDERESCMEYVARFSHVTILRSMTKMYSMAGVRLGYCVSQKAHHLKAYLPHWNVSNIAIALGVQALDERTFTEQSRLFAEEGRQLFSHFLQRYHCIVSDSVTNYVTFRFPQAQTASHFYQAMLKQGIVLRHTYNFKGMNGEWLRVAIKEQQKMTVFKKAFEHYVHQNH